MKFRGKHILCPTPDSCRSFLLWWTLFTVLLPAIILGFTEPYSLTTVLASLLLPGGVYLLLMRLCRRPGIGMLALFPFMFFAAFQIVIINLFNGSVIATDMFTNLFTTTPSEAGELLGNMIPALILICALYLPPIIIGIYLVREKVEYTARQNVSLLRWGIGSLLCGLVCVGISEVRNSKFSIKEHIYPVNVFYNIYVSCHYWNLSENFLESTAGFRYNPVRSALPVDSLTGQKPREIYVLVVGEASRAASWGLFGYERNTTPNLLANKGVVPFGNVFTQSNATHKSVPIILSSCSAENYDSLYVRKGVVTLFKEAGFRTAFISNEPLNHSLIDYFADEADTLIRLEPVGTDKPDSTPDGKLLEYVEQQINSTNEDLFIVLHTYGSHFDYRKRYPKKYARFKPDEYTSTSIRTRQELVNAYDNTIYYTDYVLDCLMRLLEKSGACSALMYCADHGEDLMDDKRERFLHASPTTTYYQLHVASFAWFSNLYQSLKPQIIETAKANGGKPATSANVFPTITDIAGLSTPYVNKQESLVNPSFKVMPRQYVNDHCNPIPVAYTGLTRYDVEQFEKRGLTLDGLSIELKSY